MFRIVTVPVVRDVITAKVEPSASHWMGFNMLGLFTEPAKFAHIF